VLVACVGTAALAPAAWPGSALMAATLLLPLLLPSGACCAATGARTHGHDVRRALFLYGVTEPSPSVVAGRGRRDPFASLATFVALVAYLRVTRPQAAGPDIQRP